MTHLDACLLEGDARTSHMYLDYGCVVLVYSGIVYVDIGRFL